MLLLAVTKTYLEEMKARSTGPPVQLTPALPYIDKIPDPLIIFTPVVSCFITVNFTYISAITELKSASDMFLCMIHLYGFISSEEIINTWYFFDSAVFLLNTFCSYLHCDYNHL